MAVLLFAVEVEILDQLDAPDRDQFFKEAADAYRARARCLRALGRKAEAKKDRQRADKLEARAGKLAREGVTARKSQPADAKTAKGKPDQVGELLLINAWSEPVVVVVDGVSLRLQPGEQRKVIKAAGKFTYEVPVVNHRATATLEAGKGYTIRVRSREE